MEGAGPLAARSCPPKVQLELKSPLIGQNPSHPHHHNPHVGRTSRTRRLLTLLVLWCVFQCNMRRVMDYPALWGYLRDILHLPGVKDTVNQEHIQKHYQVGEAGTHTYIHTHTHTHTHTLAERTRLRTTHAHIHTHTHTHTHTFFLQVSHTSINPFGIVSIGPDLDYDAPHGRDNM